LPILPRDGDIGFAGISVYMVSAHAHQFRFYTLSIEFLKTTVAFSNKEKTLAFEHYLKSAGGRAFTKKRL
jgi:hypothetical protein